MGIMTRSAISAMNTAYYRYWRGDLEGAQDLMITIAKHIFKEEKVGKRKQEAPVQSEKVAAPDRSRKGYVSRVQFPSEESLEDARYQDQF